MVVPNRFSARVVEREQTLRALAVVGALMGSGVAATTLTAPGLLAGRSVLYGLGLGVALLAGLVAAGRLWIVPRWDALHSGFALAVGAVWLVLGFLGGSASTVPHIVVGGMVAGVGLAGFATQAGLRGVSTGFE